MTGTARTQRLLLGCWLGLIAAGAVGAEVFTHKHDAENFEAVVTADQLVVKERYQGATTIYGDLSCPLGPAVSATILPLATDGRLCLQFSKDRCKYTRFQNGEPIHGEELKAPKPRMCIALASPQDAQRFAALVNSGPQAAQTPSVGSTGSVAPQPPVADAGGPGVSAAAKSDPVPSSERTPPVTAPAAPPVAKVDVVPPKPTAALPASPPSEVEPRPAASASPAGHAQSARRDDGEKKSIAGRSPPVPQTSVVPPGSRISGHPYTGAPSGTWVTESFVVGPEGSRRMAERTYAAAFVGQNAPGKPPGEYLYIRNKSDKHLLFYSLGDGPQLRLEPGNQVVLALGPDRTASRGEKHKSVTLLWFDAVAKGGRPFR